MLKCKSLVIKRGLFLDLFPLSQNVNYISIMPLSHASSFVSAFYLMRFFL